MEEIRISGRLRRDAHSVWEKLLSHPFVVELYAGTLPMDKFRFYVLQDYNYLVAMMKNLAILASKAVSIRAMRAMLEIAHLEASSEFSSYDELLHTLGYSIEDAAGAEPSEVNVSYMSYLLSTSSLKTFWEGLAATLPCFWSYAEIAKANKERLTNNSNAIYTEWASVYLTESYQKLVDEMRGLLDESDAEYEALKQAFITASKYEFRYWDMAYNMRGWALPPNL